MGLLTLRFLVKSITGSPTWYSGAGSLRGSAHFDSVCRPDLSLIIILHLDPPSPELPHPGPGPTKRGISHPPHRSRTRPAVAGAATPRPRPDQKGNPPPASSEWDPTCSRRTGYMARRKGTKPGKPDPTKKQKRSKEASGGSCWIRGGVQRDMNEPVMVLTKVFYAYPGIIEPPQLSTERCNSMSTGSKWRGEKGSGGRLTK